MADLAIKKECQRCNGTGEIPNGSLGSGGASDTCPRCSGSGSVEEGGIDNLATILDNLDTKMDRLDAHLDVVETKIQELE